MKKINDPQKTSDYIQRFNIDHLFSDNINHIAEIHTFQKDDYLMRMGDSLEYYYFLVHGRVKLSYLFENGKATVVKFYHPLKALGDIELIHDEPITTDVLALSEVHCVALPAAYLREHFLNDPKFLRHLVTSLSLKLHATVNNLSYNVNYPLINRLASYLIDQPQCDGKIELITSYIEIAEFLGTTYRHLNRILNQLSAEAIIEIRDKSIVILDNKALEELALSGFVGTT